MRKVSTSAFFGFLLLATTSAARADISRLISSGDPLPGGGEVLDLSRPVLNESGDVLVQARFDLEPDGSYDGRVIVLIRAGGSPVEIARSGDPAGSGSTIANFSTQSSDIHFLSDNGRAAFQVVRSNSMGAAIMSGIGGAPILHYADGDPAPASTQGETISKLFLLGYTDDGEFLYRFNAYRPGWTAGQEFWRSSSRLAWPAQAWGATTLSDFKEIAVSETGDLVLNADDQSLTSPNDRIWVRPFEGGFIKLIDELEAVPGGGNFQLDASGGTRMYNESLSTAFGAELSGVPVPENKGVFYHGAGSPVKIMGLGGSSLGGGTWSSMDVWDFDASNHMLIRAEENIEGDTNWYQYLIRSGPGGTLSPIAREGDVDPLGTGTIVSFSEAAMNSTGRVAALGAVRVGSVNQDALWIFDGNVATTLAQVGETFDGQVLTKVAFAGRVTGSINRRAMNQRGDVVFLAGGAARQAIYLSESGASVDAPPSRFTRAAIESVRPNPFNPHTTIRWTVGAVGPVELVIYDFAGRRVRTLVNARMDAGSHETTWTGLDESGRRVASGTYICRLKSAGVVRTAKLALIQ